MFEPPENPATKVRPCKECGDLYVPHQTNRNDKPVDSQGYFVEDKCWGCRRGEEQ